MIRDQYYLMIGVLALTVGWGAIMLLLLSGNCSDRMMMVGSFGFILIFGSFGFILIFGIALKFFRQILFLWYSLAPFYYLPYWLSQSRGNIELGGEWFFVRAGKDACIVVFVLVWIYRVVFLRKLIVKPSIVSVAMLAYIAFGLVRSIGFTLEGTVHILRLFVEYTVFFFIAKDMFVNKVQIQRLIWVWILSSIGVSLLGSYEYFIGGINMTYAQAAGQTRIISTMFNPNALGWYLAWANGLVLGLYIFNANCKARWALLAVFVLNSVVIVLSGSRSALLVLMFLLCFAMVGRRRFRVFIVTMLLIAIGSAFIIQVQLFSDIDKLRVLRLSELTRPRIERIEKTWSNALTSPQNYIWGRGDLSDVFVDAQYVNVFYSGGVIGLALLGLVFIGTCLNLRHLYLKSKEVALPLLLSSLSIFLIGFMGSILFVFPSAMLFWSAVGLVDRLANLKINRQNMVTVCID